MRIIPVFLLPLLVSASCGNTHRDVVSDSSALVTAGDSTLMLEDVLRRIPSGLAPEDSAEMFRLIVDNWVSGMVLADVAAENIPDIDRIERMVEAYRRNLIVNSYLSAVSPRHSREIPESELKAAYESRRGTMTLDEPLVRGAFLKVAAGEPDLNKLRMWLGKFDSNSIDNIEKNMRRVSQYVYFADDWQTWSRIADMIPYRFFDADAFLNSTTDFETEDGGNVYLLHISAFLPSGSEMPYEYAKLRIAEDLYKSKEAEARASLLRNIYKDRIEKGWLKPGLYNPATSRMEKLPKTN